MPRGTSRKKQLSLARQAHLENQATLAEDSDEDGDSLKSRLYKAEQQTQLLEQQLVDQVKVCTCYDFDWFRLYSRDQRQSRLKMFSFQRLKRMLWVLFQSIVLRSSYVQVKGLSNKD